MFSQVKGAIESLFIKENYKRVKVMPWYIQQEKVSYSKDKYAREMFEFKTTK